MKNEKIKVAQVIGKLNAAGVEAVINNYYRFVDRDRFQFDFYIDADSNCKPPLELENMGARYIVIPPYQELFKYLKTLEAHFREEKYDIVHVNMNTLSVFALWAAKRAGVPVRINHNHSTASKTEVKRNVIKNILRPFAKFFATDYMACSKYAGEWLFGKKDVASGKVKILNNAIALEKFDYNEEIRRQVREELGLTNAVVIGHVGRFSHQKNHKKLIDIFKCVVAKENDAVLLLIGMGELQDDIRKMVKDNELEDKVLFLGVRKDVDRLYQAMDAFVLPSFYEGLPVVAIEAQASGTPCVLSDAMTKETKVVDNAIFMNLEESDEKWAEMIMESVKKSKMHNADELKNAGFDIRTEAVKLMEFYESRIKEF